jgi:hypothetical protein
MLLKILYELMPVLYVAVGFAAALLLYNSYAILSGILLLSVALVILYMRLERRTETIEQRQTGSSVSNPSYNNSISPRALFRFRLAFPRTSRRLDSR